MTASWTTGGSTTSRLVPDGCSSGLGRSHFPDSLQPIFRKNRWTGILRARRFKTMKSGKILLLLSAGAFCQTPAPGPLVIDLSQALARARQYGGQVQAANLALAQATQDRVQARAATLPQASALSEYLYTEGNGPTTGDYVANHGDHHYNGKGVE